MGNHWYYQHNDNKRGPFSGRELRDLADAGKILRTDTVWKEGVEKGVPASKVQYLFPVDEKATAQADVALPDTRSIDIPPKIDEAPTSHELTPPPSVPGEAPPTEEPPRPPTQRRAPQQNVRKFRAVPGRGATIVGQDGTTARIKKTCTECGYQDACYHRMRIAVGVNKANFYCPKCRRTREVQFRGMKSQ